MVLDNFSIVIPARSVRVTDAPYNACGDGKTNDRAAIQNAIDDLYRLGGGTVILPAGKTYYSASLTLRSHVELHFEDGAVLEQSGDVNDYVKPIGAELAYESYKPRYGHNYSPDIKWSHMWYKNYPMIFAPAGTHDFAVTGKGTIYMMKCDSAETCFKICPVGFFRCSDFIMSDFTIQNYHSYAMMPYTCNRGLFKNLTIKEPVYGNGDGISLMNCQDIRCTGCDFSTGDDSFYIFSSFDDPRGGYQTWWSSHDPQPSVNIEVDHCSLVSGHCKGFGMILWGMNCPDLEKVEVRNVYVHDNYIRTMGNWLFCPYTDKKDPPPVTTMRFENNVIDAIECNFFETQVSDMNHYHCTDHIINDKFRDGRCFWAMRKNANPDSAGVTRNFEEEPFGYISHLDEGDAALYQGIYIREGCRCRFSATVRSDDVCRMFIKDLETGAVIAEKDFCHDEFIIEHLDFTVPVSGNYHVGIERGNARRGSAQCRRARVIGNVENAQVYGYNYVINVDDNEKILYFEKEDESYDFFKK